jgi:nitroreductase
MEFQEVVGRRRMVRNYRDNPVSPDQLGRILKAARRTPSAGFSQGQTFVVIDDPEMREKFIEAAGLRGDGISQMHRAPAFVVVCTSEKVYRDRYMEPDKRLPDGTPLGILEWPVPYWWVDAGASMMLLLLAVVDEGLSACFFGLGPDGWGRVRELLGIPEHVTPAGIVSIGHPAPDRRSPSLKRGWKAPDEVIHYNRW